MRKTNQKDVRIYLCSQIPMGNLKVERLHNRGLIDPLAYQRVNRIIERRLKLFCLGAGGGVGWGRGFALPPTLGLHS